MDALQQIVEGEGVAVRHDEFAVDHELLRSESA